MDVICCIYLYLHLSDFSSYCQKFIRSSSFQETTDINKKTTTTNEAEYNIKMGKFVDGILFLDDSIYEFLSFFFLIPKIKIMSLLFLAMAYFAFSMCKFFIGFDIVQASSIETVIKENVKTRQKKTHEHTIELGIMAQLFLVIPVYSVINCV